MDNANSLCTVLSISTLKAKIFCEILYSVFYLVRFKICAG